MLDLQLKSATPLKTVLEALHDMFSKVDFNFSQKGFELQAMDTSRVVVVALLRVEAFNRYRCDRDLSMCLNLDDVANAFYYANNNDIITIKSEEDWFDIITFKFESPADDDITHFDFDFEVINDMPRQILEYPEFRYQAIISMSSAKFMRICKILSRFGCSGDRGTVVSITVDEKVARFFTRGKSGISTVICRSRKPEPTHIAIKEKVSLKFDLRCMNSISKVTTLSDKVTISLSTTLAVFECKIAEVGYVRYYMMPMGGMENEGNEIQN